MKKKFVHLHTHSEYSLLDGAMKIDALLEKVSKMDMPAVALTDHGNIFGAPYFFLKAKEYGIKPILGAEVYVAPNSRFEKKGREGELAFYHLLLLVEDETGYKNMVQLLSKSYLEGFYYKPRVDKELLSHYNSGLIALSSCLRGEVPTYILQNDPKGAEKAIKEYQEIFGRHNFFLELMDNGLPEQKIVNSALVELASKTSAPIVATNDVHYLSREDALIQDVLLCIQTGKTLKDPSRLRFSSDFFYLRSSEEMLSLFSELPEAIDNSLAIAGRCNFEFFKDGRDKKYHLPRFKTPENSSEHEYLEKVVNEGFEKRLNEKKQRNEQFDIEKYKDRLRVELETIKNMGFSGYFLIVWDIVKHAKERGIPVGPGRGSAVGSLVSYFLGISEIDPIQYDLLFERFLNPERISLPDIDIDFCGRRREEVIEYVVQKYGKENVAQIITFGTMASRAVVRDVGRVLEIPLSEINTICKLIPMNLSIDRALEEVPQLKEKIEKDEKLVQLINIAKRLEGFVRHTSTHAAGIVIAPKPLTEYLPLYLTNKNEITTQFSMGDIEALGLLKMDFLGLRHLTIIQDTLDSIKRHDGKEIDIHSIPLDDKKTFELFSSGNTDGVFQFESHGMKELLRKFKPSSLKDLIALNALYRPGPLRGGEMVSDFIKRRHSQEEVKYKIPELQDILEETYGVIIYQEQVMRIANKIGGFSLGEADLLRKAMGKKVSEIMLKQREKFVEGAVKNGVKKEVAEELFSDMESFASYAFNKSHSAAYTYLAYIGAYLKTHYPVHFMASLLTNEAERGASSEIVKYINECKNMNIEVLPPDINESDYNFTVVKNRIRFGLSAIKNVGESAIKSIIEAKNKLGRFRSLEDFVKKIDPRSVNRKVLESLIKAGALDSLEWKRAQLFHSIDAILELIHKFRRKNHLPSLFGEGLDFNDVRLKVKDLKEWDNLQLLQYEKEALGFYITSHPLTKYSDILNKLRIIPLKMLLEENIEGNDVILTGVVTSLKVKKNSKGEKMAIFMLEDLTGSIEVVAFSDAFKSIGHLFQEGSILWIKGFLKKDEKRSVYLKTAMPLEEAITNLASEAIVRFSLFGLDSENIASIKNILGKYKGNIPVIFEISDLGERFKIKSLLFPSVNPCAELKEEIESLFGEGSFILKFQ
ncbi:MAG: DNA polymerase III subunit alpha [Candidatus Aminicenantia bacterium]